MSSPSPLVPQGAIPPRSMSRSARVLVVGFTVVAVHVVGLSLFLLQGCKKDLNTAEGGATNNTPSSAMSFPTLDTNAYYTNVASLPTSAPTNAGQAMMGAPTGASSAVATTYGNTATPTTATTIAPPGSGIAPLPTDPFPSIDSTATPGTAAAAWTGTEYKIAKGDTLSGIAAKNGVTISAIQQANPGLDPRKLKIGQTVKVPAPTARVATATATGAIASAGGTYKVKSGDTLTRIASKHGVTVTELRTANNMRTTRLLVGQTLKIPAAAPRATAAGAGATQPQ